MADTHTNKNNRFHVFYNARNRYKQNIIQIERTCVNGDMHCRISWEVWHYRNKKIRTSFATCVHLRYPRLYTVRPSSAENNRIFPYVIIIVQSDLWSVLITKYNINIMLAIYWFLSKEVHLITLVLHTILGHFWYHAIFMSSCVSLVFVYWW